MTSAQQGGKRLFFFSSLARRRNSRIWCINQNQRGNVEPNYVAVFFWKIFRPSLFVDQMGLSEHQFTQELKAERFTGIACFLWCVSRWQCL